MKSLLKALGLRKEEAVILAILLVGGILVILSQVGKVEPRPGQREAWVCARLARQALEEGKPMPPCEGTDGVKGGRR